MLHEFRDKHFLHPCTDTHLHWQISTFTVHPVLSEYNTEVQKSHWTYCALGLGLGLPNLYSVTYCSNNILERLTIYLQFVYILHHSILRLAVTIRPLLTNWNRAHRILSEFYPATACIQSIETHDHSAQSWPHVSAVAMSAILDSDRRWL